MPGPLPNQSTQWQDAYGGLSRNATVITNIRIFGCKVQALVPKEHRRKLDAKTRSGILAGYVAGGAYLVHVPENGAGDTITSRTVVFYEDQLLPPPDNDEIQFSTQLERTVQELVERTEQLRLDNINEEKEDVVMGPRGSREELAVSAMRQEPMEAARLQARLRGDPRQEKALSPLRRSSQIPRPGQRRLDFEESHMTLEEVCQMIEERMASAQIGVIMCGTHLSTVS